MKTWTTTDRPKAEQYPYWREVLCEAFTALNPIAEATESFASTVHQKSLLGISVTDVESKAQSVYRGAHEIVRNPGEFFFLNMQLEGNCLVRQDGREALIRPNELSIVDSTRCYDLIFEDWRTLSIRLPRQLLLPRLTAPNASTAVRIYDDGSLGTVALSFMRSFLQCPETIPAEAQRTLIDTLATLLALALGATAETKDRSQAAVRQALRNSIISHVRANISSPDLRIAGVAKRFRISPRYLHKLFEESDRSFSQTVLDTRLNRCAGDLVDPTFASRSIAEIAYKWGFVNIPSFCRVFNQRYGMTAREYRNSRGPREKPVPTTSTSDGSSASAGASRILLS
ncbi:helix-turn-helix protein [Panacagrimonas perspica]|uniref:Helix-turn-helix protein n=1 Tax=Panacagrimonas perspica TaxID=381431 RepID=A0A4S3K4T2_9GAMM|nr:helix-turn-helix domain-containing protein [Panacagrimonas perspica]TDU31694.1 helix-turn-helix protein [Panacagrimonas perspica]THD03090.1 hypothetical protein B1810_10885 [Panacagrimonas perspica]